MKKIKLLTPILGVSAIGASFIPMVTSCSSTTREIPIEMLNIDGHTLKGFKENVDISGYNTLVIPEGVQFIEEDAFNGEFYPTQKGGYITTVRMPKSLRQIKQTAFANDVTIRVLDFSKWTANEIYYARFAPGAFSNTQSGGKIIFNADISSESKDALTNMLADAGVDPAWALDESTDKISADQAWVKQDVKLGTADFLFKLNVELKNTNILLATATYTSGTTGVNVWCDYLTTWSADGTVELPVWLLNHGKKGDFANFNITFTCANYDDGVYTPLWKQTLKGFKLSTSTTLATELSVSVDKPSIAVGETAQITATVGKEDADDKTVGYYSLNDCATVDKNGVVTGVKSGTAEIAVDANGGINLYKIVSITIA